MRRLRRYCKAPLKLPARPKSSARIPGLSKISAAALLTEMPELGTPNKKQVASLAGLAPLTRQSGKWRGRYFIGGGRKLLRDSLYMPALVAMRHTP